MADFDITSIGEMGHLLGEFGEASNSASIRKVTRGNDIAFVHDVKDMPPADKMERYMLYVHRNEKGDLCASALKETYLSSITGTRPKFATINLSEALTVPEDQAKRTPEQNETAMFLERIGRYVDNRQASDFTRLDDKQKSDYGNDVEKLFGSTSSVISRTNREAILNFAGNVGAVATAVANAAIVPILGSKSAISAFQETSAGKFINKEHEEFMKYNSPAARFVQNFAKKWDAVVTRSVREVAAVAVVITNTAITAISGSKNSLPLLADSTVRRQINDPSSALNKLADTYVRKPFADLKAQSPALQKATDVVNAGVTKFHKFTNSKAVSHGLTMGLGIVGGLAVGGAISVAWPVTVPGIAVFGSATIVAGAKAEQRRADAAAEKAHLSDLVKGIGTKQHVLEHIEAKGHSAAEMMAMLGIAKEPPLKDVNPPKITTFRATHSYAEKEVGRVLLENAPIIVAKSVEAVSNPLGVGLEGAALAVGAAMATSTKLQEHQARHYLDKENALLRSVLPDVDLTKSPQALARRAKETAIEAETLEAAHKDPKFTAYLDAAAGKATSSLEVTKLRTRFAEIKAEVTKKFEMDPENAKNYSAYRTQEPEKGIKGSLKQAARSMQEFGRNSYNYLFNEKSSYKESLGLSDEVKEVVKRCSPEERKVALEARAQQHSHDQSKTAMHQVSQQGLRAQQAMAGRASFPVRAASMQQQAVSRTY